MEAQISLVTFKISTELYGIDIMEAIEIVQLCEITPIPNSPDFIDGVINLRGDIIPVVDLTKRFHFKPTTFTPEEELLRGIIIINVKGLRLGVIIDQIFKVLTINKADIQNPPEMITGVGTEYVQGVIKLEEGFLLILLNTGKLFNQKELIQLTGE